MLQVPGESNLQALQTRLGRAKTAKNLKRSHTSAGMPSEWKFVVYSLIIEMHSKNSDCILCAFQIVGHILVSGRNVLLTLKTFGGAFEVEKYRTALEVYSNCTVAAF